MPAMISRKNTSTSPHAQKPELDSGRTAVSRLAQGRKKPSSTLLSARSEKYPANNGTETRALRPAENAQIVHRHAPVMPLQDARDVRKIAKHMKEQPHTRTSSIARMSHQPPPKQCEVQQPSHMTPQEESHCNRVSISRSSAAATRGSSKLTTLSPYSVRTDPKFRKAQKSIRLPTLVADDITPTPARRRTSDRATAVQALCKLSSDVSSEMAATSVPAARMAVPRPGRDRVGTEDDPADPDFREKMVATQTLRRSMLVPELQSNAALGITDERLPASQNLSGTCSSSFLGADLICYARTKPISDLVSHEDLLQALSAAEKLSMLSFIPAENPRYLLRAALTFLRLRAFIVIPTSAVRSEVVIRSYGAVLVALLDDLKGRISPSFEVFASGIRRPAELPPLVINDVYNGESTGQSLWNTRQTSLLLLPSFSVAPQHVRISPLNVLGSVWRQRLAIAGTGSSPPAFSTKLPSVWSPVLGWSTALHQHHAPLPSSCTILGRTEEFDTREQWQQIRDRRPIVSLVTTALVKLDELGYVSLWRMVWRLLTGQPWALV